MAKTRGMPSPNAKRKTAAKVRAATPSQSPTAHSTNRRSPRIGVRKRVDASSRDRALIGFTRDISIGGIFLTTDALLPIGTELNLRLALSPDAEPTELRGVVVRSGKCNDERGMAIAFRVEAGQPEKRMISAFIRDEKLQVELKRAEASRHDLSRERCGLEEERLEVQHERLRLADAEAEAARRVRHAEDAARAARREIQAERSDLKEQMSRERTKLGKQRAQVRRDRRDIEKRQETIDAEQTKLQEEDARSKTEITALRETLEQEREAHAQDVVREKQFAKHLAVRKTAKAGEGIAQHLSDIEDERKRLRHVEGMLKIRLKQIEDRAAAQRGQHAEIEALFEQRHREFENELMARERKLEAKLAAAAVREEDLQRRLRSRDLDANQSGRDSNRRINALESSTVELELRHGDSKTEIARLNDEITRLTTLGDIFETEAADTKEDRALLSNQLERIEDSKSSMQEQLSEALEHLNDAEQKLALKSEIIGELEREWQARLDESEAECARLREQLGEPSIMPIMPIIEEPVLATEDTVLTPAIESGPDPLRTLTNPFTGGVTVLGAPPRAASANTIRQTRSSHGSPPNQ